LRRAQATHPSFRVETVAPCQRVTVALVASVAYWQATQRWAAGGKP
jgi:hypothetical protein